MRQVAWIALGFSLARCSPPAAVDAGIDSGLDALSAVDASMDSAAPPDMQADTHSPRFVMPACSAPAQGFRPVDVRCQHFVDSAGRTLMLHGINARVDGVFDVTFSDGRIALEPIPALTLADTQRMRALGFNLIRLPINWSGLEPTDHGATLLDAAYIARVHAAVDLARQAGLLVLLDFHEDAYSKEIGEDGAPLWAISPPPSMLLQGPLTDLGARRASTQTLSAFATFFGDADPGPALRARFASMATAVAREFQADDSVLGYEAYNEPIAAESDVLRLNASVASAIRAADSRHLIAFEPSAVRNLLDRSLLPSARFPVAGAAYAPHIYTSVFSPDPAGGFTRATLRASHANAENERAAWGTPLLVTEWGYDPNGARAGEYVALEGDLQDEFGESAAFWLWKENSQGGWGLFDYDSAHDAWTERTRFIAQFLRVVPEAVAGWPEQFGYDRAARTFSLRFAGDSAVTAPTRVFVPEAAAFSAQFDVECDGQPVTAARDAATGLIDVTCNGDGEHTITVTAR